MRLALGTDSNPISKFFPEILRCLAIMMALALIGTFPASAGELVVYNLSNRPITCSVDGYTKASGAAADLPFRVEPGQRLNVPPSFRSKDHSLNFVDCGGLRTRSMNITPESPDRVLFLNGRQRRLRTGTFLCALKRQKMYAGNTAVSTTFMRSVAQRPRLAAVGDDLPVSAARLLRTRPLQTAVIRARTAGRLRYALLTSPLVHGFAAQLIPTRRRGRMP